VVDGVVDVAGDVVGDGVCYEVYHAKLSLVYHAKP